MKRTILLLSVLGFISYQSHAQINEGRIQVGGSVGFNHQKLINFGTNPDYKSSNVSVMPSIGSFYKKNKLAGLFLNFNYADVTDINFNHNVSRVYGGGLYFRQYQPVLNKLYIFLNESGGYNYQSGKINGFKTHSYLIDASLQTGMAYDITKRMQLELSLNNLVNAHYQKGSGAEGYGISTSLEKDVFSNIGFGFRYYIR